MKSLSLPLWSLSLGLALALAGCGDNKSASAPAAASSSAAAKKRNLAFVTNNASDFWKIARAGTADAASQLPNVNVDFRIPSAGTAAEQTAILNDLLAKGIDGVAISPIDPGNETALLNKIAAETLLITHDSDAPQSKRVAYIGTDNVAAGHAAGKLIKEALPNGGKIMAFVGSKDAQNAKERFQGIQDELKGSKIEIIDLRTDDTDRVRAKSNVADTLVKYPDVAGLVGLWSYNGPAILNAVKAANKVGAVKIICFDEEDETLAGVADGSIYGTVVQQPYEFGKQSILLMNKYLDGDKSALSSGRVIVPTLSIKKDNVADFQAKLKKQLGK